MATNQNGYKPEWPQTGMDTDWNGTRSKWPQNETATDLIETDYLI